MMAIAMCFLCHLHDYIMILLYFIQTINKPRMFLVLAGKNLGLNAMRYDDHI